MRVLRIRLGDNVVENAEEWAELPSDTPEVYFVEHHGGAAGMLYDPEEGTVDWPPVALSLAEAKAAKAKAIESAASASTTSPFAWNFGSTEAKADHVDPTGGTSLGPAGPQTLQIRNMEDKTNWIGAAAGAILAVINGEPTKVMPIKTSANVWVQTQALQVLQVLAVGDGVQSGMLNRQQAILAYHGVLKKALAEAEDAAAVAAIDETVGWP